MAKGPLMLQLSVTDGGVGRVRVPELQALVFDLLDGDTTTVEEIAVQRAHILSLAGGDPAVDASGNAIGRVALIFADPDPPPLFFHAPSSRPSPPVGGAGMVLLQVFDFGIELLKNDSFGRAVVAHAYLNEVGSGVIAPDPEPPVVG